MPESIPASLIIDALKETFREARAAPATEGPSGSRRPEPLGWILSVPDTHQRTVLAALDKERALRVVTCATEDEANAIAAGLHIGGEPYVLMIQHAGLYASINTLRGVALDGRVPSLYLIGLLGREKDKDPLDSRHSMVRYCEPLLDTFGVPHARLEGPNDVHLIPEYYRLARERRGPAALLVGLETS
ncbi:MAG TPA: thiamine pyrophosphate-binding protein [Methylomirabilota bacterium]|jgi:sulfopyruvate decarboxylase TPP-binding subunit|nr:thiamine pyrophosphate-binding protein [Methylomirabilota bacterium]